MWVMDNKFNQRMLESFDVFLGGKPPAVLFARRIEHCEIAAQRKAHASVSEAKPRKYAPTPDAGTPRNAPNSTHKFLHWKIASCEILFGIPSVSIC
jgi:hypothetical protein